MEHASGDRDGVGPPATDLVLGTAGVVLAAVWAGGEHARDIAATGGEALLQAADQTKDGLDWAMMAGRTSRTPNYSHGMAGIATALAIAGAALNRDDFIVAARHGAQHLLTVGSLADGGFIIPTPCRTPAVKWNRSPTLVPRASGNVTAVCGTGARRRGHCRRARRHRAAATVPALGPGLRCSAAPAPGFLG